MKQTWRWFGPADRVSVDAMLQAGVEGVVSALHHVPTGETWGADDIRQRMAEISVMSDGSASGLHWDVVESLPVSEAIKKQQGDWRNHIENYKLTPSVPLASDSASLPPGLVSGNTTRTGAGIE